jgi:hypothetical protein
MENEKQQRQRTLAQNRALHKFCDEVANECVAHGVTIEVFLQNAEVEVTPEIVKSLWRKFGEIMFGKKSTADLTTSEFSKVGKRWRDTLQCVELKWNFHQKKIQMRH